MNRISCVVPKFVNDRLACATNLVCEFRGEDAAADAIVAKMASGVRIPHGWGHLYLQQFVPGKSSAGDMAACLRYLSRHYATFQQLVRLHGSYSDDERSARVLWCESMKGVLLSWLAQY